MTRRTAALSLSTVALAVACGGTAPVEPPTPAVPEPPGCCAYEAPDGSVTYRTDLAKDVCLAAGDSWSSGATCDPVCCVIDGAAKSVLAGDCGRGRALADASACAPGAATPSVCCTYENEYLPIDDVACRWEKPGELTLTYRAAGDRTGAGRLVANAACDTVCCEYASYEVGTVLRARCGGTVVAREPCVPQYPATKVCCRTRCDTTGGTEVSTRWSADGTCGDGMCDGKMLDAAECAGLADGQARSDFESDPDFVDGQYVGPSEP